MSREERELDLEYTGARRSLFVVVCLLIAGMLFGLFDLAPVASRADDVGGISLGHSALGTLFVLIAVYVGIPQLSSSTS